MTRRIHNPEGRALTLDGAHEAGRVDAVETVERSRRHPPARVTRLPQPTITQEREAERVWRERMATPAYRIEHARAKALDLSRTLGDALRGYATLAAERIQALTGWDLDTAEAQISDAFARANERREREAEAAATVRRAA